ncbi:LuxR C-terminal-related transcriptional regulator [Microbispora sp. ATCC PTA-5024]|uniref:LuxR C-terminal-related transcriptional regulator n=1 Tax=Microbispora sp. ATCC PTA-5024 TaxID=316330 RepID=UPI0003DD58E9|nr:LuxR C-terminal-related transcriptional regulator [Microbispora sp. ATCC PTA-5024]ETK32811.1 hypothetical protein MPTA5024_27850 [Microbispora sp. ATCC PTA-5024]
MDGHDLLERQSQLEAVQAAAGAAAEGAGTLLTVEGGSGLGKTRLIEASADLATGAGLRVLTARIARQGPGRPLGLARHWLEDALTGLDDVAREAVFAGAAAPARAVLDSPAPQPGFPLLHGLLWCLVNLSRERPLALIADDAHAADEGSLRFIAYVLPRLRELPVLIVLGVRPDTAAASPLLSMVTGNPLTQPLVLKPLSASAGQRLVAHALADLRPDPAFCAACHISTGGNPLLLNELAGAVRAAGVAPTAANAHKVNRLGASTATEQLLTVISRLAPDALDLARAIAVLGGVVDLPQVAELAGLPATRAFAAAAELDQRMICRLQGGHVMRIGFVLPLVESAFYHDLPAEALASAHSRASALLIATGDDSKAAGHLLLVRPTGDDQVTTVLVRAAGEAMRRSAPEQALRFLERALREPPGPRERAEILRQASAAARMVHLPTAARWLGESLPLSRTVEETAEIGYQLGLVHVLMDDAEQGVAVWRKALDRLPPVRTDLRDRLDAALLAVSAGDPPGPDHVPGDGIGGSLLDCAIASRQMGACDPAGAERARRALDDQRLGYEAGNDIAVLGAGTVLLAADEAAGMPAVEAALARARWQGSLTGMVSAQTCIVLGLLWQGQLAEAEGNAREVAAAARRAGSGLARRIALSLLADTLIEQAREAEAAEAFHEAAGSSQGTDLFTLGTAAKLARVQGDHAAALDSALACGTLVRRLGLDNPALVPWRSEAVFALRALGHEDEAERHAREQLELARRWGAPRAIGHALRVSGGLGSGPDRLRELEEAISVLESSPARLELGYALAAYGCALHEADRSTLARRYLGRALDIGAGCGAAALMELARGGLRAAGARPRRSALTGPDSLTPSERQVAELAAEGLTNRDIARELYITAKTVEVHLSKAYRKLRISGRKDLARALASGFRGEFEGT